jgi:hypothetical protein
LRAITFLGQHLEIIVNSTRRTCREIRRAFRTVSSFTLWFRTIYTEETFRACLTFRWSISWFIGTTWACLWSSWACRTLRVVGTNTSTFSAILWIRNFRTSCAIMTRSTIGQIYLTWRHGPSGTVFTSLAWSTSRTGFKNLRITSWLAR